MPEWFSIFLSLSRKAARLLLYPLIPRIFLKRQLCHFFHRNARKTEFLGYRSQHQVNAISAERIILQGIGKVYGIKKLAVDIQETAKMHPFPFNCVYIFDGHQVTEHPDLFA